MQAHHANVIRHTLGMTHSATCSFCPSFKHPNHPKVRPHNITARHITDCQPDVCMQTDWHAVLITGITRMLC
jgi:hypothetical protein